MLEWPPQDISQTVRFWTLRRGDETAVCEVLRYWDGRTELAVLCGPGQELRQAFRVPATPLAKAEELRQMFVAYGFADTTPYGVLEH